MTADTKHPQLGPLRHALWAACGTGVVIYVILAALDAFDPGDVLPLTVAAVAAAALVLAHEWRALWREERRPRG